MAKVGIFSRESADNYRWLLDFLYTFLPQNQVRSVTITNHSALSINGVSFAILYHSKKRGRINVTDVTDSLYDEELEELSQTLGAENVIVVIDDLDDNGDPVKVTILENQPSIRNLTRDLFLFNIREKQDGKADPTNSANKSKIREMITERSAVRLFPWMSLYNMIYESTSSCFKTTTTTMLDYTVIFVRFSITEYLQLFQNYNYHHARLHELPPQETAPRPQQYGCRTGPICICSFLV